VPIDLKAITARHIAEFNGARLEKISELNVHTLLKRKNPYLFIARRTTAPQQLADQLVRAALSSSEETLFGQALEAIAIAICEQAYGGRKSTTTGIDLEFDRDGTRYIVSIKSGPSWGNASQVAKNARQLPHRHQSCAARQPQSPHPGRQRMLLWHAEHRPRRLPQDLRSRVLGVHLRRREHVHQAHPDAAGSLRQRLRRCRGQAHHTNRR